MTASIHPISPLRQRMLDDMRMRKFGDKTQLDYVRAVRNFTKYLGRSPDSASVEGSLGAARSGSSRTGSARVGSSRTA